MNDVHYLVCSAPICQDDPNPNYKNEVIWRPGEKVCKKTPYEEFQINELVRKSKFKNMDHAYTASELENRSV